MSCNSDMCQSGKEKSSEAVGKEEDPGQPLKSLFAESLALQEKGNLMKACTAVATRLHPHQMIALNWMFNREVDPPSGPFWVKKKTDNSYYSLLTGDTRRFPPPPCVRGGILADDMGLGKTLSVIALILTNFYEGRPLCKPLYGYTRRPFSTIQSQGRLILKNNKKRPFNNSSQTQSKDASQTQSSKRPPRTFTNVFDISEEKSEDDFTDDDDEDVPSPLTKDMMSSSDEDHPEVLPEKKVENNSSIPINVDVDEIDDNFSQRLIVPPTEPCSSPGEAYATLIVCPLSLLHHWASEFDKHLHRSVKMDLFMYYGENKGKKCSFELERFHVVVTTYGTLSSEYRNEDSSPLLGARWLRVVLDEGHLIRNDRTHAAQSVMTLRTQRKWILTGTPVQNKLTELYSLVNWLGVEPFTENKKLWKALIEKGDKKECLSRLQVLLTSICMRRVKNDRLNGRPLVNLPSRMFIERRVAFSGHDAKIHEVLRDEGLKVIERLIKRHQLNSNFGFVLALLMKMRLYCCHPELIPLELREKLRCRLKDKSDPSDVMKDFGRDLDPQAMSELNEILKESLSNKEDESEKSCPICLDTLSSESASITQCKHVFCIKCLKDYFSDARSSSCPLCRSFIQPERVCLLLKEDDDAPDVTIEGLETSRESPKLSALLDELATIPPEDKVIIVSQFTSFLSMVQPLLDRADLEWVRLDGSMSLRQRGEVLDSFSRGSPRILLLSLKAGGIGLNLVAANHLFLLDPTWNPADEDQCFDRIYRLGQEKPVRIIKYIVQDSIEERMLTLQKHKRDLAKTLFNRNVLNSSSLKDERIKNFKVLVGLD